MADHPDTQYARTLTEGRRYPALTADVSAEVCVIGGGLAGVATALDLIERGRSVVLLEQHRIGWGASGRNGGFASPGLPGGLQNAVPKLGLARVQEMYALTRAAQALIRERIARYGIDCGPIVDGALRCAMAEDRAGLQQTADAIARDFGTVYEVWPRERVREALATPRYGEAWLNPLSFSLHPLNFVAGMARAAADQGAAIFEQTAVTGVSLSGVEKSVRTSTGSVRARHVVFACGGYIDGLFGPVSRATIPIATFVVATRPLGERLDRAIRVPYAVSDIQSPTNYYRKLHDGRLLWGGRVLVWERGRTRIAADLQRDIAAFYPDLADAGIETAWGGLMPFTRHKLPSFGALADGVWYATGFGGLGLVLTTTAGTLIAAGIAEGDDRWRLFARSGLPFAGGKAGRVPAQIVYWRNQLDARFGRLRAH
jgi:gamma-glutamylputrescine oxidase